MPPAIESALVVVFYCYTRRAEQDLFEKRLRNDANKILQSIAEFFFEDKAEAEIQNILTSLLILLYACWFIR